MIRYHKGNGRRMYTHVMKVCHFKGQSPQRQLRCCSIIHLYQLIGHLSLFLPKFFNFLDLSIYVSHFPHHLLSHHFTPNIPLFTSSYDEA